jgi:hypothetical protein
LWYIWGAGELYIGFLVEKPVGKRPLGRRRRRWDGAIKMELEEMGWGSCAGLIWLRIGTGGGLL